MVAITNRLTARGIATIAKPGRHADGGGLYLQVGASGAKSWLFMYKRDGRRRELGLGSTKDVPLALARQRAADARRLLDEGRDPLEQRRQAERQLSTQHRPTFAEVADELLAGIEIGFRNEKHRAQWRMTLGPAYCASIRDLPVDEVSTAHVLAILQPIWSTKAETASRLRGRIERVLDAAKARGLRQGENPARFRGHLDSLLSKRQRLQRGHHAAMPYSSVPAFVSRLQASPTISNLALEFAILSGARSGETLGARWEEMDLALEIWTIPGARMKAGREHRVPISPRMKTILEILQPLRTGEFVFPGRIAGKPLSGMAMEMVLRRMKITDATVHGFRSSFRDWVGEETDFAREIAEAALAHIVGSAVERAYRRGDALEKRRELMCAWATFCERGEAADR